MLENDVASYNCVNQATLHRATETLHRDLHVAASFAGGGANESW